LRRDAWWPESSSAEGRRRQASRAGPPHGRARLRNRVIRSVGTARSCSYDAGFSKLANASASDWKNLEEGPEIRSDQELMHRGHAERRLSRRRLRHAYLPHTEDRARPAASSLVSVSPELRTIPASPLSRRAPPDSAYSSRLDAQCRRGDTTSASPSLTVPEAHVSTITVEAAIPRHTSYRG